ncbi:RNA methyltransferase [Flavobacteriaceae bacterium]|nr:RNA methyltransferase [Flavobacteriaceae bacterium]
MALSKNNIKLIESLKKKKGREKAGLFIVEGKKSVGEFIASPAFELFQLFCTEDSADQFKNPHVISEKELKSISLLVSPDDCLALFTIPEETELKTEGLILALDQINDPGNFGTIIRLADWFGVGQIWCAKGTVDRFNPKVVQSSMGSLTRVSVVYGDLIEFVNESSLPSYATAMDGNNIYNTELPNEGIIIMGNEANGVSEALFDKSDYKLAIPGFGEQKQTESLNVAMATGIILSEFRRRSIAIQK